MIRRALVSSVAALFLAFAFPLTANAQSVFVLAGGAFPLGDYGDFADTGWMLSGGLTFSVGEGGLFAGVEGLYSRSGTASEGVSTKPYSAMGFIGYSIPTESSVAPYIYAGGGLQGVSVSTDLGSESESAFGYQFGAGVAFTGDSNVTPLIDIRYQGSGDESVDLNFIGVSAGVSIGIGNN